MNLKKINKKAGEKNVNLEAAMIHVIGDTI